MPGQLTPEKIEEVERLWRIYGAATAVADAAGIGRDSANRYKPPNVKRRHLSRRQMDRILYIESLWHELKDAQAVAQRAGVHLSTAKLHCPAEYRPEPNPSRGHVSSGYSKWSEEVRERWNRFWDRPTDNERMSTLFGWNEGWLGTKRQENRTWPK